MTGSRPLTCISDSPNDMTPLSADMDIGEYTPDLNQIETVDPNRQLKYRKSVRDALLQTLWTEYLGHLQLRNKNRTKQNLEVGEVLIG